MEKREIIVTTRKEFQNLFRTIWISNCDEGDNEIFNFGWAINNWTSFTIIVKKDGIRTDVELIG